MTATTARRRRAVRLAAATLTAAAALTLTACGGSDSGAAKSGGGDSSVSQGEVKAADGDASVSSLERCHTSGLEAVFATGEDAAPDPDAEGSTTTAVIVTNTGDSTCRIGGFPGVDLKSENGGQVWSLARSSESFGEIELSPGDSTSFTINIALGGEMAVGFYQPAYAEITPPNETSSLRVEWPWGELVDQRGATHPATYVNPIG